MPSNVTSTKPVPLGNTANMLFKAGGAAPQRALGARLLSTRYDSYRGMAGTAALQGLVGGALVSGGLRLLSALESPGGLRVFSKLANSAVPQLAGLSAGSVLLNAAGHVDVLTPVQAIKA